MNKKLTEKELIELGSIDTSSHPLVSDVKKLIQSEGGIDSLLNEKSQGAITSLDDRALNPLKRAAKKVSHRYAGCGYLSSSLEHDYDSEIAWTAITAELFKREGFKPLVIPIDEYYSYIPGQPGLHKKTTLFSDKISNNNEEKYIIILTGISQSCVFTPQLVSEIPSDRNIGSSQNDRTTSGDKFKDFSTEKLSLFLEDKISIDTALDYLTEQGITEDDARFSLGTALALNLDSSGWQALWYERREGVPMYVIAPQSFHDAIDRATISQWGPYKYRCENSLGGINEPISFSEARTPDNVVRYEDQGVKKEEFEKRTKQVLDLMDTM